MAVKLSVSSLYFKALQVNDLYNLKKMGIDGLELVLYHQFGTYDLSIEMKKFKSDLDNNNLAISGIQGFTFWPKLNMKMDFLHFSLEWTNHLGRILKCANLFNTSRLIFGAPVFRNNLCDKNQFEDAFYKTHDYLVSEGVNLLLEATPNVYGSVYLNTFDSVLQFNSKFDFLNHFDTGCYLNQSDFAVGVNPVKDVICEHLHVSACNLGYLHKDPVLQKWLSDFNLPPSQDNYLVMEATLQLGDVLEIKKDIDYILECI